MAFSTTMLSWSAIEFGTMMGPTEKQQTLKAIRWATDYFLKATSVPGFVFAQVGDPYPDHNCWERPEDMDTPRTPFAVSRNFPGSEVSGEKWVCPFYCDFSGYEDELVWAAAWMFKATKSAYYWSYVIKNTGELDKSGTFGEFGWDTKTAGINVLVAGMIIPSNVTDTTSFIQYADRFVCTVLPESPTVSVQYSPGGLLFKPGGSNMQHVTALSFLLITYGRRLQRYKQVVHCGNVVINHDRLYNFARSQVDYLLGTNPLKMSYMVGYGSKFPQKIHHRASSLPSIAKHRERIDCQGGTSYFASSNPNPNQLTGAVVGGPDIRDNYFDSRDAFVHSEPTTYINAPLVGVLGYFKLHP
ncbi:Endoglucanase 4 [Linum perenne]